MRSIGLYPLSKRAGFERQAPRYLCSRRTVAALARKPTRTKGQPRKINHATSSNCHALSTLPQGCVVDSETRSAPHRGHGKPTIEVYTTFALHAPSHSSTWCTNATNSSARISVEVHSQTSTESTPAVISFAQQPYRRICPPLTTWAPLQPRVASAISHFTTSGSCNP